MSRNITLQDYKDACTYPGILDAAAVEAHLADYLRALGIEKKIVRLERDWTLDQQPSLARTVDSILDDFGRRSVASVARVARVARDARDASDARVSSDARERFAGTCLFGLGWWSSYWDLGWLATTYFGANQLKLEKVVAWSKPCACAYIAGCWMLYWTDDTVFWIAKPTLVKDPTPHTRRLHCANGPAFISDILDLYFWKGVLVPDHWISDSKNLAAAEVFREPNAEVRRAGCEILGWDRVLSGIDATLVDADSDPQIGTLYEGQIPGAKHCGFLRVECGTGREFVIPVPSGMTSAIAAQAWVQNVQASKWIKPEVRG